MKYTCPTCGKTYDTNYCEECKKVIAQSADNSNKNAMTAWGVVFTVLGALGVLVSLMLMFSGNIGDIYILAGALALVMFGLVLLGISAVVDRLNTIIKMLKEK